MPLVSICLPNLNTRPFLEERMDSIFAQTLTDWELIICDSFSDDGSWEFFQKFKNDPRVRLHQVAREGVYAGWNECLRRAAGEFIYIATSDDTAKPGLLESLVAPLMSFPEISIAVCDYEEIDEASQPVPTPRGMDWKRNFLGEWMTVPCIRDGKSECLLHAALGTLWHSMTTVLFRRRLLERTGLFRTDRGTQADYDWTLRASLASDIAFVPGQLATWRWRQGQSTPHERDRAFLRQTWQVIDAVIHDPTAGVPPEWKSIPRWDELITQSQRTEYQHKFMLYRGLLRDAPGQFARNVWAAMREEPSLLLRRASRGFAWTPDCRANGFEAARELLELFHTQWPPRKVSIPATATLN